MRATLVLKIELIFWILISGIFAERIDSWTPLSKSNPVIEFWIGMRFFKKSFKKKMSSGKSSANNTF